MKKYTKDGKVGVLVSPKYGAGWSTWAHGDSKFKQFLLMDKRLVQAVLDGKHKNLKEFELFVWDIINVEFPEITYLYFGGVEDLVVEWIENGVNFMVSEYDGYESIEFKESDDWMTS